MNAGALALAAFLLSPRALAGLGNVAGHEGALTLVLLALVAALHYGLGGRGAPWQASPPKSSGPKSSGFAWHLEGAAATLLLPFWCASLLGIAGYAFNESFLNWFPNLGFSFLLLGLAALLALVKAGERGLALCGLAVLAATAVLAVTGLVRGGPHPVALPSRDLPAAVACLPALLLGARLWPHDRTGPGARPGSVARYALLLAAAAMAAWALLFTRFLEPGYLAEATTPHLAVARALLGPLGRPVAGAAVIAACLAGVALMLKASAAWLSALFRSGGAGRTRLFVCGLAVAEALALGLGYAGEEATEHCIAGGTAAWLAALALHSFTARPAGLVLAPGFLALAGLAVWAAPEPFISLAFAVLTAAAAVALARYRKKVAA